MPDFEDEENEPDIFNFEDDEHDSEAADLEEESLGTTSGSELGSPPRKEEEGDDIISSMEF